MVARFEPRDDLDVQIAQRILQPRVRRALDMLEDAAKAGAPPTRVWVTMRDDRVRKSHMETDGQTIPGNLRFRVPKVATGNDVNDIRSGYDLARHPRDPALPVGNRIGCRCADTTIPFLLAESIHKTEPRVIGTRVDGSVYTRFPRAAESEYGGDGDEPAHFMTNALHEVALRLRSSQSR